MSAKSLLLTALTLISQCWHEHWYKSLGSVNTTSYLANTRNWSVLLGQHSVLANRSDVQLQAAILELPLLS